MKDIERYLNHLDSLGGPEPTFNPVSGNPPVTSITYADTPQKGYLTAFTYGLSLGDHPVWTFGKPELMISVKSNNIEWATAAAAVAFSMRGECPFSLGTTIDVGEPIASDSAMSAFFVFAPLILEQKSTIVKLSRYKLYINQLYPIYKGELDIIKAGGLEPFFKDERIDFADVTRRDFSQA